MENLKVKLGKPEHGWLPTSLWLNDKLLEFDASDVPVNPIDELLHVLLGVLQGYEGTVWWHLEPEGYYLHFEPKSEMVLLTLTSKENKNSQHKIAEMTATKRDVVLTFWAAIETLLAYEIGEYDWPKISAKSLNELEERVKEL